MTQAHLRRAEILFLYMNGAEGVEKNNKKATARLLMSKYPDHYSNMNSAYTSVKRTLTKIDKKRNADPDYNPLNDGRTTAKKPLRVRGARELRNAVEERILTKSARQLGLGMYPQ